MGHLRRPGKAADGLEGEGVGLHGGSGHGPGFLGGIFPLGPGGQLDACQRSGAGLVGPRR